MIFSKPRNFIFLRVPKTASTSIHHQILDNIPRSDVTAQALIGYKPSNTQTHINGAPLEHEHMVGVNRHVNLKDMIRSKVISEDDLQSLNVYGVIRDPIDRIISCAHHYYFFNGTRKGEEVSNDIAVEQLIKDNDLTDETTEFVLIKKQTNWLMHNNKPINKIFRYDQIDLLVKEICGDDSVKYNHRSEYRKSRNSELSSELRQECLKFFPEDFALWESLQPPASQP